MFCTSHRLPPTSHRDSSSPHVFPFSQVTLIWSPAVDHLTPAKDENTKKGAIASYPPSRSALRKLLEQHVFTQPSTCGGTGSLQSSPSVVVSPLASTLHQFTAEAVLLGDFKGILQRCLAGGGGDSGANWVKQTIQPIEDYGRLYCSRNVGFVRSRQQDQVRRAYEGELKRIAELTTGAVAAGSKVERMTVQHTSDLESSDHLRSSSIDDENACFLLGFAELLCDTIDVFSSGHAQDVNRTEKVGAAASSDGGVPSADFGRLQRNCNSYRCTANHPPRQAARAAFRRLLQDVERRWEGISGTRRNSSSNDAALSPFPVWLFQAFPTPSKSADVELIGVVCLWEVFIECALTRLPFFAGTLLPVDAQKARSALRSLQSSSHGNVFSDRISSLTTFHDLISGRGPSSDVNFRIGDAIVLAL